MKDLGEKIKNDIYAEPAKEAIPKIRYPEVSFPLDFVKGMDLKVDDDVDLHIKGRVSGMEDTKWSKRVSFECKQGEISKTSKKDKSLLDENNG